MRSHYLFKYKDHRWGIEKGSISNIHLRNSRTLQIFQCLAEIQKDCLSKRRFKKNVTKWKSANKQKQQQAKETKKHSSGGFRIKGLFYLTIILLGGVVYSDVQTNGSWKDSNTAYLMKKYHVCEYSHKVLNKTSESIKWVNLKIDNQFPGYEKKLHETLEPYSEMLSDVGQISYDIILTAKLGIATGFSIIADSIEDRFPGLLDQTRKTFTSALSSTAFYTKKGVSYLRDEFFVGNMSPENMSKVAVETLTATQQKINEFYVWSYERAQEFYVWGHEKVRTVIK
ncbi:hypothetical protein WA026_013529 [Henosepilachna vigintioctopunctata]|uniref:Uncharacterized protein n=1 Tax=Henosepilachna vigintioctopunctata TaxID=420089 RepID=A0AAW1V7E7_9CUCU